MKPWENEDDLYEMQWEFNRNRKRNYSCADGFCGADDCERCRPGCTNENNEEEGDENDNK